VRDDSMTLFGFASTDERELFALLVPVTGVGPKVALSFLSVLSADALRRAVASGDVAALTVVPGVGKKVAQRVVLDLKDKLGGDLVIVDGPLADGREALLALGRGPAAGAEEEREFDAALRPRRLDEFVGQERIKEQLALLIDGARARGETVDHRPCSGPAVLGE